ncbi:probable cytochrome P450 4d14 [Zophobas morio]|uniref:probable cytochrome P450 4d14 n=1 Tax=Zophobas morio TaxID=2755281 RepID=UPI00308319C5
MATCINRRLKQHMEKIVGEYQAGFRKNRSTVDQIFILKQLQEVHYEQGINLYLLFIDFKIAYDTVNRKKLLEAMKELGVPRKLIKLTKMTLQSTRNRVRINGLLSEPFQVRTGLRQGDPISTTLFNLALEAIIRRSGIHRTSTIYEKRHQNIAFADDVTCLTRTEAEMKKMTKNLIREAKRMGLAINQEKTKFMKMETKQTPAKPPKVTTEEGTTYEFEEVNRFKYLGVVITNKNGQPKTNLYFYPPLTITVTMYKLFSAQLGLALLNNRWTRGSTECLCSPLWPLFKPIHASRSIQNAAFSGPAIEISDLCYIFGIGKAQHCVRVEALHALNKFFSYGKTVKIRLGPTIFPITEGLATEDYNLTEFILSSNKFLKKSLNYYFFRSWLGNGLLKPTSGNHWKKQRKILTPTFHFEILKEFVDVFESVGNVLVDKLEKYDGHPSVDLHPLVSLCTLDVICETAMGTKINVQSGQNSQYVQSVKVMCRIIMERLFSPIKFFDLTFFLSKDYYIQRKALKILHGFTMGVINSKQKTPINTTTKKMAFLDLLLKISRDENALSVDEIREEVDTFMFEGHDTTASGISFTLYCLAEHSEVQEKVLEEQKALFGNEKNPVVTYSELQRMKYLEYLIKEVLRLYPSVPVVGRLAREETEFDGYLIPRHTNILISIFHLHRNPNYFPDPEDFKPERFERFDGSFPHSFIPFSAGSRNCIGQKFAVLEMKSVISNIIRHFEIRPTFPKHELELSLAAVLKSENGVKVVLRKRD